MPREVIHVVRGQTSGDQEVWPGVPEGTIEWQFSDAPSGCRGSSADFLNLEDGIAWANARGALLDFSEADL